MYPLMKQMADILYYTGEAVSLFIGVTPLDTEIFLAVRGSLMAKQEAIMIFMMALLLGTEFLNIVCFIFEVVIEQVAPQHWQCSSQAACLLSRFHRVSHQVSVWHQDGW